MPVAIESTTPAYFSPRDGVMRTLAKLCTLTLALFGLAAPRAAQEVGRRPNLLFILTDDQRFDLMGCAGHPILKTPNMDRLARQGTRFRNMFVTTPICA